MCLFLCQHHTVLITVALQYSLQLGHEIHLILFFFLKTILATHSLCGYIPVIELFFYYISKKWHWNYNMDFLESVDFFG